MVEPKVTATVANLSNLKTKPGPFLSKLDSVAQTLQLNKPDDHDICEIRDTFIDNLVADIESRLENP